MKFPD